jgi:hypothetical protein
MKRIWIFTALAVLVTTALIFLGSTALAEEIIGFSDVQPVDPALKPVDETLHRPVPDRLEFSPLSPRLDVKVSEIAGSSMIVLDDFNRENGPIGPNWTVHNGYCDVSSNAALCGSLGRATYNDAPGDGNAAEADVEVVGTDLQYTGLLLNYGAGSTNLFIKVQQQSPLAGQFTHAACYTGNNDSPFGLGFFELDSPFNTAHMSATRVGDDVTIEFTNIDGGAQPPQVYVCTDAPPPEGTGIGIIGYTGISRLDNFGIPQDDGAWQYGPDTSFQFARFDGEFYPNDGKVYFMGGRLGSGDTDGSVWSYDPGTRDYTDMAVDLTTPISNYTMNLLQDASGDWGFYVFCGRPAAGGVTPVVQVYYPETNTVAQLNPSDNFPGSGTCTSALNEVYNNKVYLAGGFDGTTNSAETWVFDPTAPLGSKWMHIPTANLSIARAYIMSGLVDDMIYAVGGSYFDGANLINVETVEVLDPNAAEPIWDDAVVADLPEGCSEGRAYSFDTGSPYIDPDGTPLGGKIISSCGGWPDENEHVYVYDSQLNSWEEFPYLQTDRRGHAAAFIPTNQPGGTGMPGLWVWGGRKDDDVNFLVSSEYYAVMRLPYITVEPLELFTELPAGTTAVEPLELCNASSLPLDWTATEVPATTLPPILIIQDQYPWGTTSIQDILTTKGIAYSQVGSSQIPAIDLSPYKLVIIPSNQPGDFYEIWNDNLAKFEDYVENGGALWLSTAAFSATVPEPLLPGGVINSTDLDSYNDILEPTHPWVSGVPDPMYGGYASHDSFTNLYPGSVVVAQAQTSQNPTLVDYGLGDGRILITGQTLEITWTNDWDGAPILSNSLLDMYIWAVASDIPWLSVHPTSNTLLAGECQTVEVTFDASSLPPDDYFAGLLIFSNDPDTPQVFIPVTMTVGEPEEFQLFTPAVFKD